MSNRRCSIIIPIYKEVPSSNEIMVLKQGLKLLGAYDFYLVCADNFNASAYLEITKQFSAVNCNLKRFPSKFFSSLYGYNRLMISLNFYKSFKQYEYLLIYQLDAWIFKDELEYWCEQGFDYIGAPWFEGWHNATETSKYVGVGNGGFSLRNVTSHIRALKSFGYIKPFKELWKDFLQQKTIIAFQKFLFALTIRNNTFYLFNSYYWNEDGFWGEIVNRKFKWFKVPDLKIALKFSMEVNAPMLYGINNRQLPFGCHAWERYEKEFWKQFIYSNNAH